jgi:hypothetical protein
MLTEPNGRLRADDAAPTDRSMLILQYVMAFIAAGAAALLASLS